MSISLNQAMYQQIASLVQGLVTKKGMKNVKTEILTTVNALGSEGEKYLLLCLLDGLDLKDPKVQNGSKDQFKTQFLTQRLTLCSSQAIFLDYFSQVIEHACSNQKYAEYLNDMFKCLKLSSPLQILLAVSLVLSNNPIVAKEGTNLLRIKLTEYFQMGKPMSFPEDTLSVLLYVVRAREEFYDLTAEVQYLLDTNQTAEKIPEFKPLFMKDISGSSEGKVDMASIGNLGSVRLSELIFDLGPSITYDLNDLGHVFTEVPNLDEDAILQALLMMCNTPSEEVSEGKLFAQAFSAVKTNTMTPFKTDNSRQSTWNFDNYVKCCNEKVANLKWSNVVKRLDRPDLKFADQKAFGSFFAVLRKLKGSMNFSFPPSILFEHWTYPTSQIVFLKHLFNCSQQDLVFFHESPKRQVSLDFYPGLKISSLTPPVLQLFSSLNLLELLLDLSDSDYYLDIRGLFELPIAKCPELLLLGLVQAKPRGGTALLDELYSYFFPMYLQNHSNSVEILEAVWKTNPGLMTAAISELYRKDASFGLGRVLEVTQVIKDSLVPILSCKDYNFAVSLGVLAAKKEQLNLEQLLTERVKTAGNQFVTAVIKYINDNVIEPCNHSSDMHPDGVLERANLSLETLPLIFQLLMNPNVESKLSPKNRGLVNDKYREISRLFPALVAEGSKTEIEESANTIFYKLYKEEIPPSELLDMMMRYKNSTNNKEKEVFTHMLANLFDGYQSFARYPEKQLLLTAQLFGSVLANRLIEGSTQNAALKCIFESLKKPGKMFDFAIRALEYCKGRLHEWPQQTALLFENDLVKKRHLDLLEDIRNTCLQKGVQLNISHDYFRYLTERSKDANGTMMGMVNPQPGMQFNPQAQLMQNIHNPMGLYQIPIMQTSSESPKKTHSAQKTPINDPFQPVYGIDRTASDPQFNSYNLIRSSTPNPGKSTSTTKMTNSESSRAHGKHHKRESLNDSSQLESGRVVSSSESLSQIAEREFPEISEEVKSKITFCLNNCTLTNIDEKVAEIRMHLEQAGVPIWIAKYIVYKRAPQEANLHSLYVNIVNRLNKREMFPIMIKDTYNCIYFVLASERVASEKPILRNLGSWLGHLTLARSKPIIMVDFDIKKLLVESLENNKLEFVLPMVCKILLASQQSNVFTVNNAWLRGILALLNEIAERSELKMATKAEITVLFTELKVDSKSLPPSDALSKRVHRKKKTKSGMTDLLDHITVNKALLNYGDLDLRSFVAQALERAISEIIPQVVARSVAIAMLTAKEIVLKDFALEPSEAKLLQGMNVIVQNLAGGLAIITTRDPLRTTFATYLKQALESFNLEESVKEEIINSTANDNLNLGCSIIKKTVIDRAIEDVMQDPLILDAVEKRREAAGRIGTAFCDENMLRNIAGLPDVLKPNPRGLTMDQLKVYEEIAYSSRNQMVPTSSSSSSKRSSAAEGDSGKYAERKLDQRSLQAISQFEQLIKRLDALLGSWSTYATENRSKEERGSEYHSLSKAINELIKKSDNMNVLAYEFATKILTQLFNGKISTEKLTVYLDLLALLKKHYDSNLGGEIMEWILDPQEKRAIKHEIIMIFIRKNFISVSEFDDAFADALEKHSQMSPFFCSLAKIIQTMVFEEKLLGIEQFQRSLDQINKNKKNLIEIPELKKFFEDFERFKIFTSNEQARYHTTAQYQETQSLNPNIITTIFNEKESEFFKICAQKLYEWLPLSDQDEIQEYSKGLFDLLQGQSDTILKFFVFTIDISVDRALESTKKSEVYTSSLNLDNNDMEFTYLDALSKLMIILLKNITTNKSELFEKCLYSSLVVITKYHEFQKEKFNQKPFYRLFLNLLSDVRRKESGFSANDITQFLSLFMKLFEKIQPLRYPGFAFAWLELISYKEFMPLVLVNHNNAQIKMEMWSKFSNLLIVVFNFLKEVSDPEFFKTDTLKTFYKGVMRVLLVILNDFPDFLVEMSFVLCEHIPEKFIQIRNLILSAYPSSMKPPDPLRKFEMKEEYHALPVVFGNFLDRVKSLDLNTSLSNYLSAQNNETYFREICSKLTVTTESSKIAINYPVVNAFVLTVPFIIFKSQDPSKVTAWKKESYNMFWKLLTYANAEMRDALLNAIMNNIRYPNAVTFYFIRLIFYFFTTPNSEAIQEHVIRMFDTRFSFGGIHPWGSVYTFFELLKNPEFDLKNKPYSKNFNYNEIWNRARNETSSQDSN